MFGCSLGTRITADNPLCLGVYRNDVAHLDLEREAYELPAVIIEHHVQCLVLGTHLTLDNQ